MFCVKCGNELPDDAKFCSKCGAKTNVINDSLVCPNCGNKLLDGAAFCTKCGTKIIGGGELQNNIESKGVAIQIADDVEYNYKRGKESFDGKVFDNAFKYFQTAAEQGHMEAQFRLAQMYEEGIGVPESKKHATKWYAKAAEQGHAAAQYKLAEYYLYERVFEVLGVDLDSETADDEIDDILTGTSEEELKNVSKPSNESGLKWLVLSAEQGFADALYELGNIYDEGEIVPQDISKAKESYAQAIERGCKKAILNLAAVDFRTLAIEADQTNDRKAFMDAIIEYFNKVIPYLEERNASTSLYFNGVSNNFEKKLNGALNYADLERNEIPLIIIDTSVLGSAKEGVLYSTRAAYYKCKVSKPQVIPYSDLHNIFVDRYTNSSYCVTLNGKQIGLPFNTLRSASAQMNMIKDLVHILKQLQNLGR